MVTSKKKGTSKKPTTSKKRRNIKKQVNHGVTFRCCKKKYTGVMVCVKCGNVFHNSCALRDWSEKIVFIDSTRIVCCDGVAEDIGINKTDPNPTEKRETMTVEHNPSEKRDIITEDHNSTETTDIILYLKRLVDEMTDKNRILQENVDLWKQKFVDASRRPISPQRDEHSSTSPLLMLRSVEVLEMNPIVKGEWDRH